MRIASTVSQYLLGLVFLVFGLNGFLHFIPMPPPTGVAGQFLAALFLSHFLVLIFLLQIIPAILLLVNRYVPLALVLLGPVVVNIFCFHVFMAPNGLPMATLAVVLWLLTYLNVRGAFSGIFHARHDESPKPKES